MVAYMTQYHIANVDGSWRVYATETGIDRQYVGPRCATPKEANAWADFCTANPPTTRSGHDDPPRRALPGSPDVGVTSRVRG